MSDAKMKVTREDVERLGFVDHVPTRSELSEAWLEYKKPFSDYYEPQYLDLCKIEFAYAITEIQFKRMYSPSSMEDWKRDIEHIFRGYVWGKDNQEYVIEYPLDWWQAFKDRWFPDWLLKRFPTQCIEITINSKTLYPLLNIETPDYTHTLVYNKLATYESRTSRLPKVAI